MLMYINFINMCSWRFLMYSVTVTYGMCVLIRVRLLSKFCLITIYQLNTGAIYVGLDHIL